MSRKLIRIAFAVLQLLQKIYQVNIFLKIDRATIIIAIQNKIIIFTKKHFNQKTPIIKKKNVYQYDLDIIKLDIICT